MPPVRTPVSAIRPVKTERTHEENQERAYIAASRRSDRSLEARIESARRASEIHKKRTGRGLRVTEQDVINEEMYEEEDDDLPSQYRRLQAHIASTADIFNGRLNSYLLSSLGTRGMLLDQGFGQLGQQQATPFFSYNPPQPTTPQVLSPTTAQRPQNYRQSPYPTQQNRMNAPQQQQQQRSGSISSAYDVKDSPSSEGKRSVPGTPQQSMLPPPAGGAPAEFYTTQAQYSPQMAYGFPPGISTFDPMGQFNNVNMSPFSPTLPNEAQQLLGSAVFDPNHNYTPYFMNSPSGLAVPQYGVNYNYNPNLSSSKPGHDSSTMDPLNQTLSQMSSSTKPGLDQSSSPQTASNSEISTPFITNFKFPNFGMGDMKSGDGTNANGTPTAEYDDFQYLDFGNE